MDFIFEILTEIVISPIIEFYYFAMMQFFNVKINKDKVKIIVIFECIF